MNLIEPGRTPWDLQFHVGDIPVRVHPMFWLIALFIVGVGQTVGVELILGVFIIFVSILVHELGHAFVMRWYGERARVVLYWMGGLAISGGDGLWDFGYSQRGRSPQQQIVISFAGPLAGFILAALTAVLVYAIGCSLKIVRGDIFPLLVIVPNEWLHVRPTAYYVLWLMLYINIFWGLINLLPVFPLDGGQIARQLFVLRNPYEGITTSLWLSVIVGAGMTLAGLFSRNFWMAALFGSMAFSSYQMLQNTGRGGRPW